MLQLAILRFLENYNNDSQWLGFSPKHGWVIHDKTLPENTSASSEAIFVVLKDCTQIRIKRCEWKEPAFSSAKNHFSYLSSLKINNAFNELKVLLLKWDESKNKIESQQHGQNKTNDTTVIELEVFRDQHQSTIKKRKNDIKKIIEQRSIKYLVHFTQAKNIESILKHGLLSRDEALLQKVDVCFSDPYRFDNRTNSINLSIMHPNYSMFYSKRMNIAGDWVVLLISPEVLYENNCEFSSTNAATGCNLSDSTESFINMFSESALNNAHREVTRKDTEIPDFCTTDPQGEVLVEGAINPNKIMAIAFETLTIKNRQISQLGSFMKTLVKDNFIVDHSLFKRRYDHQHWPSKSSVKNNFSTPELLSFL